MKSKSIMVKGAIAGAITGGFVVGAAHPGYAQAPAQTAAANAIGLEEIVVTARRRAENLQSVPIAVQAFSGDALEQYKIQGIQDLSKLVPALTNVQTRRNQEGLSIRGLGNSGASAQGQSNSVTSYFSEIPLPTGDSFGNGRYFDLENAQVLKGPQGTLFGRNSTGGALLVQPKRPTNDFEGYVQAQFGNYEDRGFDAAVNIPIVKDVFMVRAAGQRGRRDGFTTDIVTNQDLDNRNYWSGRVSATFKPSDVVENYLVYDHFSSHTNGTSEIPLVLNPNYLVSSVNVVPGCNTPVTLGGSGALSGFNYGAGFCSAALPRIAIFPGAAVSNALAQQQTLGIRQNAGSVVGLDLSRSWGVADIATWNVNDAITIKNIFGYRKYKNLNRADGDGTSLAILDFTTPSGWNTNTNQYSDELQVQGASFDKALTWTVGNFSLWSDSTGNSRTIALGSSVQTDIKPKERSQAVFAQASYNFGGVAPALDGLKLTGGYRYTWDKRSLVQKQQNLTNGRCVLGTTATACTTALSSKFKAPSWTVGMDYQWNPNTLLYVTGRRGYRSGGLNTQSGGVVSPEFAPERVTDVEIGVKADWTLMDMQGRTNIAAYHSDFEDAQISQSGTVIGASGAPQAVNAIVNAATATIKGVELDATLIPVTGLELTGSWSYTLARYDRVIDVFNPSAAPVGRPYPFTPLNKIVLGGRYTLPLDERIGSVSAQVTWAYSSHQSLAVLAEPQGVQGNYQTVDLRLGWNDIAGHPVDASLFMTNAANTQFRVGGFPVANSLGFASYVWNEPRIYGLTIKYRFGPTS